MLQACDASHFPTKISVQWYRDWIRRSFVGHLQGVIGQKLCRRTIRQLLWVEQPEKLSLVLSKADEAELNNATDHLIPLFCVMNLCGKPYCFLLGDRMLEIQARQHIVLCKQSLIPSNCFRFRKSHCANFWSLSDRSWHPDGQALAETLASTGSLGWLELEDNDIGDRGAEAPAAGVGDVVGL